MKLLKSDIREYIESLVASKRMSHQVAYHKVIDGHEGAIADTQKPLPEDMLSIIHQTGGDGLYRHQEEAIDLIRSGKNVVVATPTASGKTLIYNLPVMERMLINNDSRALYIFPLKALASWIFILRVICIQATRSPDVRIPPMHEARIWAVCIPKGSPTPIYNPSALPI